MYRTLRITLSGGLLVAGTLAAPGPAWSWGGVTLPAPTYPDRPVNMTPQTRQADPVQTPPGSLIQLGEPGPGAIGKAGYGNGVPLKLALGMLVPPTWVSGTEGVNPSTLVTWSDGQSWPQALGQIAKEKGWTIILDWSGHTVTVEAGRRAASMLSPEPSTPARPVKADPTIFQGITLVAGKPISEQLREQAKKDGWNVIWNVPQDWIVPNGAQFKGDFMSAASQVIQSLSSNGANIHADFYKGNRTLIVRSDDTSSPGAN